THLVVPVANYSRDSEGNFYRLGIFEGDQLVQNFNVSLPRNGDAYWVNAYPLDHFGLRGKTITIKTTEGPEPGDHYTMALDQIRIDEDITLRNPGNYKEPYRNQFHASSLRGWNNDPNGLVYHDGTYHLYYQYNPFGIFWGNMHWGHFTSTDLIQWKQHPIVLFQKTVKDMAFSGGGFVDFNNSSGLGKGTQFAAFTSTGRGECLVYSKDGGMTFTELKENPMVVHNGRDPKVIWYAPEKKWVMALYNNEESELTRSTPIADVPEGKKRKWANITFHESRDMRSWKLTGSFTDPDRPAVFECPEMFELPVENEPGQSRWILYGAQNRYFVGQFNGKTFIKESGPHGTRHGAFYAAQTYSDIPDGRRIQIGWVRTESYENLYPDQCTNQAFTLPHELTLRKTRDGYRVFYNPTKEVDSLRLEKVFSLKNPGQAQAQALLQVCSGMLNEVEIEFEKAGEKELWIGGIEASF
ncbi:MAG: glycoside hydrolase family 32 protein, partial [Verrucomicrobiae bacterium]|nr:glycoside hydrolase family 32 protein [Verrucomicrobiae bacterium]